MFCRGAFGDLVDTFVIGLYIEPVLQSFPCSSDRRSRNSCFFPAAFCFVGFVHGFPTGTAFHVHTVVTGHRGALSDKMFLFSAIWIGALSLLIAIWVLYWIFRAISVSCNLRGRNLWIVFIVGTFGGDILCRYLIGLCY